jgi:dipeptidyl aminopeptidase/acylaminoacyl peptidase
MKKITLLLFISLFGCTAEKTIAIPEYAIEAFFNNTRISGGYFSSNEQSMLYSSNESGIFNVYEVDLVSGEKAMLTNSNKESFIAKSYVPNSKAFIYSADKGGNEISHLYLKQENDKVIDLTPEEKEKANFHKWSDDKKFLYYLSNNRDSRFFDLYKMNIDSLETKMIYENKENFSVSSISDDDNYLLLSKNITTSENIFSLYSKKTDEMIEISTDKGSYSSAGFSNDSNHLYFITDVGKEFSYLMKYSIESGESKVVFETIWNVMYSYLSESEKYRVIGINEDGKNNIKLFDVTLNKEVYFPTFDDGSVLDVNFSESENNIRLSVGSSTKPNDLYVYNFKSQDLKQLTKSINPEIDPNNLVSADVIRYPSFDELEIPAIFYKPKQASSQNKVPALVWVHGGPGGQSRINFNPLIQYLTNQGYAILAVNNRGSSGYGKSFYKMDDKNHGEKDLQDCIWGKKWLQTLDYIDKDKIGIIGGSYGGYMTMAAMTFAPEEFKVGVNIFGVTNWIRTLKSIPPYWEASRNALYDEIGDPFSADSIRLKSISPLFHAENVKNPVMVLQGANDPRVLQIESDEIVDALKKNEVPVEYIVFDDEGHGFRKRDNQLEGYSKIKTFLDYYLKEDQVIKIKELID